MVFTNDTKSSYASMLSDSTEKAKWIDVSLTSDDYIVGYAGKNRDYNLLSMRKAGENGEEEISIYSPASGAQHLVIVRPINK